MNIPANDAFSLNSRSHRRRSQTRSPPPKVSFFASSPVQSHKPVERQSVKATQILSMSLRHRSTNGEVISSDAPANGDARNHTQGRAREGCDSYTAEEKRGIDWEIPRKALHSSIGFLVIHLYTSHTSTTKVTLVLSSACAIITSVDFVRLRNPRFAAIYEGMLGFLMRESEKRKTNGVVWYLLGCIFVLMFYPQDIAVVSILILSWCDTTASFFGRLYGPRTRPLPSSISVSITNTRIPLPFARRKSVAGFLAGTATGFLIALGFWGWLAPFGASTPSLPKAMSVFNGSAVPAFDKLAIVAAITGLLAGIAEAIDVGSLDDNLTLPIISGGAIWAIFKCLDYIFP